jgi:archaellum component FlaC
MSETTGGEMNSADIRERMIRLEGKVDRIADKLDDKFEALAQKIEHGDKETVSLVKLYAQDLAHVRESVANHDHDIETVKTEIETLKRWKAQVIGIALGIGTASGGVAGLVGSAVFGKG